MLNSLQMKHVLLGIISGYQKVISPLFPGRCRFYPTCSEYGKQAVQKYGALKGGWLALKRLLRCGPWSKGGLDELP